MCRLRANQFLTPILGEDRNHFDRVAHYIIGFYSHLRWQNGYCNASAEWACAFFFSLFFIMSVAAAYEIIEWQYAVIEGGNAGVEFRLKRGYLGRSKKICLRILLGH